MIEKRRHTRYTIEAESGYWVKIKIGMNQTEGKIKDISLSGICVLFGKETFLRLSKPYPITIGKSGKELLNVDARLIWYLQPDDTDNMMQYGMEFTEFITLPEDIIG